MNTSLNDSDLLLHLSEATAGSLSGIGHSTPYEEVATYAYAPVLCINLRRADARHRLAVDYLFLADSGSGEHPKLSVRPLDAAAEQNDYEIPWALRDLIADARVAHLFAPAFGALRAGFADWRPRTAVLKDVKRKLAPIQRLSAMADHVEDSKL
jgi:hypothetical protein